MENSLLLDSELCWLTAVCRWMDGWMGEWMDGCVYICVKSRTHEPNSSMDCSTKLKKKKG